MVCSSIAKEEKKCASVCGGFYFTQPTLDVLFCLFLQASKHRNYDGKVAMRVRELVALFSETPA